ncbi:hypothetical protein [Actinopolymorpha pittospori]|uniref:Uncharacterized protein n=1 Tax=Actinopolymorpha pittospori TaxID=648752 RepID=A0A927MR90_9ACTN|nr:hypothetical protein [Actinopolymorpha pittospori]MBE1603758.1 hypothetical protein [Actinopolymorpha pittospori]
MEALILALVIAGLVQRVGADWWAGVTGREFPSQKYRSRRLELRAARHAIAGTTPHARHPARQYASDMWAYTWDGLSQRHQVRRDERQQRWRRRRESPRGPQPMRDHLRLAWHTGPALRWANSWQALSDKRNRKLAASDEVPDQQPSAAADSQRPEPPEQAETTKPRAEPGPGATDEEATVIPFQPAPPQTKDGDIDTTSHPTQCAATGKPDRDELVEPARDRPGQEHSSTENEGIPAPRVSTSTTAETANERNQLVDTTTNVNAEVTGLQSARQYVRAMAEATRHGSNSIESAMSGLLAGEVSGPSLEHLTSAQESLATAANAFEEAAGVLDRHQHVAEAYDANPDAGSREFVKSE